jgi:hypothetical protein
MNYFDFGILRPRNVAVRDGRKPGRQISQAEKEAMAQNISNMFFGKGSPQTAPGLAGSVQGMAPGMFNRQPQAMPQGGMYGGVANLAQQRTGQPVIEEEPIYPAFFKAFNPFRRR